VLAVPEKKTEPPFAIASWQDTVKVCSGQLSVGEKAGHSQGILIMILSCRMWLIPCQYLLSFYLAELGHHGTNASRTGAGWGHPFHTYVLDIFCFGMHSVL
jgi:hypothetical protein